GASAFIFVPALALSAFNCQLSLARSVRTFNVPDSSNGWPVRSPPRRVVFSAPILSRLLRAPRSLWDIPLLSAISRVEPRIPWPILTRVARSTSDLGPGQHAG